MRIANFDNRPHLVLADGLLDLTAASSGRWTTMRDVFDEWEAFRSWAPSVRGDRSTPDQRSLYGAPSPEPPQVFGIGLNYVDHATESGSEVPETPPTFTKFRSSLVGPYGEIALPSTFVDWEAELVVVIGVECKAVAEENAWAHVAGVTVGQDLSERVVQLQPPAPQFSLGKSFPGFGPTGPFLVTPDELEDPDDLALGCSIDGEVMQAARTSDMIFSVPRLIAHLSAIVTLFPADVIFTGTPSGIGGARTPPRFLAPGEVLTTTIEGVGEMKHTLVSPAHPEPAVADTAVAG